MGWSDDFFSSVFSSLFGDDIFSDEQNNADAQFGKRKPGNYNRNNQKPPQKNSFGEDIPEGQYTKENRNTNQNSYNSSRTSSFNKQQQNNKSRPSRSRSYTENLNTNSSKQSNRTSYREQNIYDADSDFDYEFNNRYSSNNTGSTFKSKNTNYQNNSNSYYDTSEDINSSFSSGSQTIKKDKSASASQSFRRQHGERNKAGSYPTLSKKGFKSVANDKAVFTFGDPFFSSYDHGVRGIAFPYSLRINDPKDRKIVVSGKFCDSTGSWIKSILPNMADRFGDLVINESMYCADPEFYTDSYLFLPYGVLAVKDTQKIYLNVDVFVDGSGPQHLLRYVYGFDYYIYENDPREFKVPNSVGNNSLSSKQQGFDELIGVIAHVIKADGICAPEEVRAVIEFFRNYSGVDKEQLKDRLKFKLSNLSNLENDCGVIKNSFNTQTRLTFLALFFKISVSDDYIPSVELNLIEKISNLIGISKSEFESLKSEFLPASDKIWHTFGLTSKATKEQLRSAYKEKCKEWHPDRFANASKEEYKRAEEKFKDLQELYAFLLRKFKE